MLNFMRKHAGSWMIKALLGAIIVVFVFFYGWGFKEKRANTVASVNHTRISIGEYQKHYKDLINYYRNIDGFSPQLIETLNLKQKALDSLINKLLILQEAKKLDITVGKEELQRHIAQMPYFQKDGHFDNTAYLRFLKYNRTKPNEFEEKLRQDLLTEKLKNLIQDSVKLSEQEIYDNYAVKNEEININFIQFNPDRFKDKINPSQKKIEDYFSNNSAQFRVSPQVKVSYLCFDEKNFLKMTKILPQDINDYYKSNLRQFHQPKMVKARHILIKTTPQDGPEVIANKKRKGGGILKEAEKSKDFPSLAKKYSEGPSAKQGGNLGYIRKGQTVKPFEDTVFSLKKGEISPLVKTKFGFHIIKVDEIKQAGTKSLEEAREEIVSRLKKEKAKQMSVEMAEEVAGQIYQDNDLKKIAKEKGLSLKETDYFTRRDNIPKIGKDNIFASAAFSLEQDEVSPLIESNGKYYFIKLIEKLPSHIPKLPEVSAKIKTILIDNEALEKARKNAEESLVQLKNNEGGDISSLASRLQIKLEGTGPFKRAGEYVPRIGNAGEVKHASFSLTPQHTCFEKVIHTNGAYFIICLKEKKDIEKEAYKKAKNKFSEMLLNQKQESAFNNWLDYLRNEADVKINKNRL